MWTASSFAHGLRSSLRGLLLASCLVTATSCGYFVKAPALITMPGVASEELELPDAVLVTGKSTRSGDLVLRAIARGEVSRRDLGRREIRSHSGPDRLGRIAYLAVAGPGHEMGLFDVASGARQVLATAGGDPWDDPLGVSIALAHSGDAVATLDYAGPSGLVLNNARIVVRSTATGDVEAVIEGVDRDLEWAPDGTWMAFTRVEVVAPDDATRAACAECAEEVDVDQRSDEIEWLRRESSAVYRYDLATRSESRLAAGRGAVIDWTGRVLLYEAVDGATMRLRLADGAVERAELPGRAAGIVAAPTPDHVVYYAWPTGSEAAKIVRAPTVGPHQSTTIKVVDLRYGRFLTLAKGFSWFSRGCSLGRVAAIGTHQAGQTGAR